MGLHVVVGLGKTGLSCVRYLVEEGFSVAVVDSRTEPPGLSTLRQEFPEVAVELGAFSGELLSQAAVMVVSPGVSLEAPEIAARIAEGVPAIGDIELFVQATEVPIVAITGSNGKSTVTTLVGKMAEAAGWDVKIGGNLGTPVLSMLEKPEPDLYVLELSSFQLETTHSLRAKSATILNISEDHLDRYPSMTAYLQAKQKIYHNSECAVINRDDAECWRKLSFGSSKVSFGLGRPKSGQFGVKDGWLMFGKEKLVQTCKLYIKGHHQVSNALAALALGQAAGLPMTDMLTALSAFQSLSHRCQWVVNYNQVDWFNDSKGTNVGATLAAIEGLGEVVEGKLILIAGGVGKDADFSPLVKAVSSFVRTTILLGRDAPALEALLEPKVKILRATTMANAVHLAYAEAKAGDAVLLSPACASFDMFPNFEVRGEAFMAAVRSLE